MTELEQMYQQLGFVIERNSECVHVEFKKPRQVISSGVINGGVVMADRIVNLKVPKYSKPMPPPQQTIENYCAESNWEGVAVGLLTAASMDSLCVRHTSQQNVDITVLTTVGLSNPLCAGDCANYRIMTHQKIDPGTINIIVVTSAILSPSAMVEAVMITTEAKAAALQELKVMSMVSDRVATGTGTDSTVIAMGDGPEEIIYCGKQVLFGELLGALVIDAVKTSVRWDLIENPLVDNKID